ncbi:unnamed protein product [Paramecium pentaurelia]|uniref:Transmembrane protein n=1 Tax=Paramecium pentaurelia TaxID=43138 RepID=A0A8S1YLD7_9CILI|nr:unnamed protein product [Paramecium pentaurelia]
MDKNQIFNSMDKQLQLNKNFIIFADIDVLPDCFAEEQFQLLQLMNSSFKIVYSIQANKPIKSQKQGIYTESKTFLIYTQYSQNISIIALFSSQFKNQHFMLIIFNFIITIKFILNVIQLWLITLITILQERLVHKNTQDVQVTFFILQQNYFNIDIKQSKLI